MSFVNGHGHSVRFVRVVDGAFLDDLFVHEGRLPRGAGAGGRFEVYFVKAEKLSIGQIVNN